ncbi:MAG: hypothetical protein PWR20_1847 [Bacteroidales bacterium]|jgi:uncharacterized protein (DUF58 family)|nr:hypothetical protein [Bacteroidales bacterium]MDN5330767.1 hypothetical protein [Bacteroidales bacterium]
MSPIDLLRIQPFTPLEFYAREVVEGFITGLHKSPYHGFSVEFAEHRLYNNGESIRNIDWKLYARTERLFVKRFEEETNLRCQLVIDHSASMYYPNIPSPGPDKPTKLIFAIYAAAALLYLFRKQRDAVGLTFFNREITQHFPARSNNLHIQYLFRLMEELAESTPPASPHESAISQTLHLIAETVHKRSLVIIFSDMFDKQNDTEALYHALQHLRHNKHEVILFHTIDRKTELELIFDNKPYRFIDKETGKEIKVNVSEIREKYATAMRRFLDDLKFRCGQYHIDFIEADIQQGFHQILLPYLLKRSRLF